MVDAPAGGDSDGGEERTNRPVGLPAPVEKEPRMTMHHLGAAPLIRIALTATAAASLAVSVLAAPAQASVRDHDRDGIPTRFERSHGMRAHFAADARWDFDRDGLVNRAEFRVRTVLRDEDTDNDGHDDGDEVRDGLRSTDVLDRNTDDDRLLDGDEDADRDGLDNEDEDDSAERCRFDDDDQDGDDVATEDENELGLVVGDDDSDDDGVLDGEEDDDEDGEANEDEDDVLDDDCSGDRDGDGEDDEDAEDLLGTISSFEADGLGGGTLVVSTVAGFAFTGVVTTDTEIELESPFDDHGADDSTDGSGSDDTADDSSGDSDEGTAADLVPGAEVAEIELDDDPGTIEEIEIYTSVA
jgi:hypothetical protein